MLCFKMPDAKNSYEVQCMTSTAEICGKLQKIMSNLSVVSANLFPSQYDLSQRLHYNYLSISVKEFFVSLLWYILVRYIHVHTGEIIWSYFTLLIQCLLRDGVNFLQCATTHFIFVHLPDFVHRTWKVWEIFIQINHSTNKYVQLHSCPIYFILWHIKQC
jgi:hypothetical protein